MTAHYMKHFPLVFRITIASISAISVGGISYVLLFGKGKGIDTTKKPSIAPRRVGGETSRNVDKTADLLERYGAETAIIVGAYAMGFWSVVFTKLKAFTGCATKRQRRLTFKNFF